MDIPNPTSNLEIYSLGIPPPHGPVCGSPGSGLWWGGSCISLFPYWIYGHVSSKTPPGEKKHWGGSRELWEALALRLSRELWAALMSSGELLGDELWASLASSCSFTIVSKLCHPRKSADWQISGKSICTRGGLVL